jgi:P27 family predicted phage terminase small subunit
MKKSQGTLRKHRTPENEPQFASLNKMPPAPEHFDEAARRVWEIGAELVNHEVITNPDLILFEACCETYSRYIKLKNYITENLINRVEGEHGGRSAQAQQMNQEILLFTKQSVEFGLTPAARSRLGIVKKKEIDPDAEKMKELLGM